MQVLFFFVLLVSAAGQNVSYEQLNKLARMYFKVCPLIFLVNEKKIKLRTNYPVLKRSPNLHTMNRRTSVNSFADLRRIGEIIICYTIN